MLFGLFDTYASTSEPSARKGKYPAMKIVDAPYHVLVTLKEHLVKEGYSNLQSEDEFFDVYAERNGFEYSFQIAANEGVSLLSISVYGEHQRGRVRGALKRVYEDMVALFSGHVMTEEARR